MGHTEAWVRSISLERRRSSGTVARESQWGLALDYRRPPAFVSMCCNRDGVPASLLQFEQRSQLSPDRVDVKLLALPRDDRGDIEPVAFAGGERLADDQILRTAG